MSGNNARYALPEDERPPVDQRAAEPEFALAAPAISAQPAERPLETLTPRPLGRPLTESIPDEIIECFRLHNEQGIILAEIACGYAENRWGILNSAAWRLRAAGTRIGALTEPHKRGK